MYVENLQEKLTESNLVEVSGLRTTKYLIDDCSIEISKLQQNGKLNGNAFILAPCHIFNEFVKLHSLEFNGHKLLLKKLKHQLRLY